MTPPGGRGPSQPTSLYLTAADGSRDFLEVSAQMNGAGLGLGIHHEGHALITVLDMHGVVALRDHLDWIIAKGST